MLSAVDAFLMFYKEDLEPDVWQMYVNMPCPSPLTHALAGSCPDCENKYFELEGKDIPTLAAVRRLANTRKTLDAIIRPSYINERQDSKNSQGRHCLRARPS